MKACAHWEEAILAAALGNPPQPDFAAHLALCPPCRDAVRASAAALGRIDASLHRAATVEPPAFGPERVMARIHARPAARPWFRWAALGGAMAALLLAVAMWVRRPAPEANTAALFAWRSPTQSLLRPPVPAAWTTMPRLGEGFFKFKPSGETHAQ
jgi:hypothetical protein